ncbi:MAG: CHAT domain-containing tetratricopeptide repeat protein, partial [Nitrospinales bacterium]
NLASLYQDMGDYGKAEPLFQRSLKIKEKKLVSDHPDVAVSLNNLALLYSNMGDYDKAEPLYQRSLKINEKVLGPDHPKLAVPLNNLASLYQDMGDYGKAVPLLQRSLAIREKALGPDHPGLALVLNNLASLYQDMGDYGKAEPLYQRSHRIWGKALGPDHPDVGKSLNNIASLYVLMGDYGKAEPLFQKSLTIYEKALGPDHPGLALVLNNLASLYQDMGDYGKAEPLYQRSFKIWEKALGPDHPDIAAALNNLAMLYHDMGDYGKAVPLLQKALAIREKVLGPDHPDVAVSLNNLATLNINMGDFNRAESLYQRSLSIKEETLGPDHPDVAVSLNNLATLEARSKNYPAALIYFWKALAIEEGNIQNIFSIATEEQKLKFIQKTSVGYQAALSLIHQQFPEDDSAVRFGLDLVLRRKGIVLDAQSRVLMSLKENMSPESLKDWEALSTSRGRLAQILLNKPKEVSHQEYRKEIESLQKQIEKTEKRLIDKSGLIAQELKQRKITSIALSKILQAKSALVEFVKIPDYDFGKNKWKDWRYLAFILRPDGTVTLKDLGDAEELEKHASNVLKSIQASEASQKQTALALNELFKTVWLPLENHIQGIDNVWISPDGILNLIPFAALMNDAGGHLLESYELAYVTSGRELIGMDADRPNPESNLLLVANPAYDRQKNYGIEVSSSSAFRSRDFRGHFSPLPGTQMEAETLPALVPGSDDRKKVVTGDHATEGIVKSAKSPSIMHLATHGFFIKDNPSKLPNDSNRTAFISKEQPKGPQKLYENPLLRSGLAFAGANHASEISEGDDGILTALEISGMNLYGTDLVVLSACETGVGEVKNGEGVFGLRRSFALAGARNLMMSLWPIADKITANQMTNFYKNLQTHPPATALRKTQLETIRQLKKKYGFASPALWAPFIIQGIGSFEKLSLN